MCAFSTRRFERTLPLTVFSCILLLYGAGLFDALRAGFFCVLSAAALCWVLALIHLGKTRGWRSFCARFFTPAFCFYAALFLLSAVGNLGRLVEAWDDLTHWADVVRQMCQINRFGASGLAFTLYPNYPPAMSLLQYYVQMLYRAFGGPNFCEWLLFPTYSATLYALFMPFMSRLRYKNWFTNLCLLAAVFSMQAVLHIPSIRPLDIDPFLGALAGCALAGAALGNGQDRADMLSCVLAAFVLTISKASGLYFAVAVCAALLIGALKRPPAVCLQRLWPPCGGMLMSAFAYLSWEHYLNSHHAYRAFSGAVDLSALGRVIAGQDGSYRQEVWRSFWRKLFVPVYQTGILDIYLSFMTIFALLLVAAAILYLLRRRANSRLFGVLLTGVIATLAYMLGMGIVYLFKFPEGEALRLASFDRYMGVILLMLLSMLLCLGTACMEDGKPRTKPLAALLVAILLLAAPALEIGRFMLGRNVINSIKARAPVDAVVERVKPQLGAAPCKVNLVALDSEGLDFLCFALLCGRIMLPGPGP